jgi:UDP-3-O-[3-hydroxymyristoyl] glucosamine N-acyltransferase
MAVKNFKINEKLATTDTTTLNGSIRPSLLLDFAKSKELDPRISFSRNSTATYYDGTSAKAEENLFSYSQEFDNAAWNKTVTVIANATTAPDGTVTADKIISFGTGHRYIGQTVNIGVSVNCYGNVDLTTGVLISQGTALDSFSVVNVFGDASWWRIVLQKAGFIFSFYANYFL